MNRRQFLTLGASGGVLSITGCIGFPMGDSTPEYPGGTLLVSNTSRSELSVTITTVDYSPPMTLETTIPSGELVILREFVSTSPGTVVTLAARIGDEGEPKEFEFLPNGGGDESDAPPEYARLTIQNAVEESATWTAREGT